MPFRNIDFFLQKKSKKSKTKVKKEDGDVEMDEDEEDDKESKAKSDDEGEEEVDEEESSSKKRKRVPAKVCTFELRLLVLTSHFVRHALSPKNLQKRQRRMTTTNSQTVFVSR